MKKRIAITSECVCDLPEEMLEHYNIDVIYFYIETDRGCFKDRDEISSRNIIEYFESNGEYINTLAPAVEDYEAFFEKVLKDYDEIVHLSITATQKSTVGTANDNANKAAESFSGRVSVYDSQHLSSGLGHMAIKAAGLVREGKDRDEVIRALNEMKDKVHTSFIAQNAEYLYRNGRTNKFLAKLTSVFRLHPILGMKNAVMLLQSIEIGDYEKAVLRYVRKQLKHVENIDKNRVFITHAGCSAKMIAAVKREIRKKCGFEQIIVTNASATVTSNCGMNAIGVIYIDE